MKGWLDNYGKKENANEGRSSAPKEWRGEGYSNVGRNYSPAWGGQFEEGGEIPQAQKGRRTPVYVNDPNDPRLKLYSDSASVFNRSQNPWHWPGTKVTTKQDYEKKIKLQHQMPHWSFDEDQYKKDKKKGKFKDFNDYIYDVGLVDKDPRAMDAYNRNVGKNFEDLDEPVEKKLPDGRIKQYWGKYKGKIDDSQYSIYDPVTGSTSGYSHSGDGPDTFLGLFNPNIKPIGHTYYAFDAPYNTGEINISSEDSEYVNKVLKNKTKKKKDYSNYTYGANDNEVYKEPVQPVIYDKKKYNPNDPRLKQLQEAFDKFHGGIKGNAKGKEQPKEEPSLKKKVTKMEPITSKGKPITPQLRTIEQPNVELPAVQRGKYRTSYYDPEMKDWNERAFMSQQESDQFANEMSQRGYPGAYGNVTQRVQYSMGGSLPGSVGFTYARTNSPAPSEGPYAKKTLPSAQKGLTFLEPTSPKLPQVGNHSEVAVSIGGEEGEPAYLVPSFKYGEFILGPSNSPSTEFRKTGEHLGGPFKTWQEADEWERTIRHPYVEKGQDIPTPLRRWGKDFENGGSMSYYKNGLDWKPKSISRDGSVIKDDNGYWNPDNWGKTVEIDSPDITMEDVYEPLIGESKQTGEKKLMLPGKNYKFANTKQVIERPIAKSGIRQEQKGLQNLEDLTNFTNYNKPTKGGWLNKYN